MKLINRQIKNFLISRLKPGKVVILSGARRVGKSFLIKEVSENFAEPKLILNGEDFATHELLQRRSTANYKKLLGSTKLLIIDEAQKIPHIGLILKLLIDSFEELKILVTGSSAFDISNKTGEPLTGRKIDIQLFPISETEIKESDSPTEKVDNLRERLIFGNYPEVINLLSREQKIEYLRNIINSYLLKDILVFENLKNSSKLFALLKLVAFQVGNEVSISELGRQLAMSKNTVERYLDLLSKVFILHKLGGYSGNLRKEVVKSSKWYFYDNGIRNAIIANFNTLENRNDIGNLWENYMISERLKFQNYSGLVSNNYFWRTYDQQEIDWVEEREGRLFGYELKWKEQKIKPPAGWINNYSNASFEIISSNNYEDWLAVK